METRDLRRQGKAPTISDVAKFAGVSPMTVSRVINKETNVRPSTRDSVNKAIEALGYSPNPAAQSLAGAGQIRIGLLYSNPSATYLSEFLVGCLDQARRNNAQLVVEKCEPNDHEGEVTERLIASGIDGLILPPPLCDSSAILSALTSAGALAVAVATGQSIDGISAVSIDDRGAACAMTSHILALGHERVGFIMGNPNQTVSERRFEGYRDALANQGVPFVQELVEPGLFTYHSGLDAADRLLDLSDPPTAIFASNDDMAAATVAIAHKRGLDVPGNLTVCGFDDTALATTIWPELTTIRQPIADMSRAAINLLIEKVKSQRMGKPLQHNRTLLDFTLVRRQSDAAPRRRPKARLA